MSLMSATARRFVVRGSLLADRVVPPPEGLTVLIYHRVGGGSDSAVDLDVDEFDRQMAHLVAHHRVLSLGDALAELSNRDAAVADGDERRPVVVTFDDGTADFLDHAVPVLVRHQVPATLYVATLFVDEQRPFPWDAPPASWSALRAAQATGLVDIGSHTHSHFLLHGLEPGLANPDLDRSIELIGEHLGVVPADFAYPKAVPPSTANEILVRRRFRSAVLAGSRVNRPGTADLHRLWRTPVQRNDSPALFAAKAGGGLRLDGTLRAVVARRRYRHAIQ